MNIDIKLHKDDLPEDLLLGNSVAIDGEFLGLNFKRDPLCLIQLSSGNYDAHIVQLNRKTYEAPNLVKLLTDKKIQKIFHFARADLTFIKYYLKVDVENAQCTKLQSRLARTFSDRHGLKDLITFLVIIAYFSDSNLFILSLIGMFNVSASIVFDWVRHTIQNRPKDEKESDKNVFIKLGIVFWSVPTRNFILVFSLIMQYPAAIVYYTCFPGTYFTIKKAWSLVILLNEN